MIIKQDTLILCSLENIYNVMKEIKNIVLSPRNKYYIILFSFFKSSHICDYLDSWKDDR